MYFLISQVVFLVLGSFSLCWLPYFSVVLDTLRRGTTDLSHTASTGFPSFAYECAFTLAMANSGLNPIIYAWKNRTLRKALLRMVRCRPPDQPGDDLDTGAIAVAIAARRHDREDSRKERRMDLCVTNSNGSLCPLEQNATPPLANNLKNTEDVEKSFQTQTKMEVLEEGKASALTNINGSGRSPCQKLFKCGKSYQDSEVPQKDLVQTKINNSLTEINKNCVENKCLNTNGNGHFQKNLNNSDYIKDVDKLAQIQIKMDNFSVEFNKSNVVNVDSDSDPIKQEVSTEKHQNNCVQDECNENTQPLATCEQTTNLNSSKNEENVTNDTRMCLGTNVSAEFNKTCKIHVIGSQGGQGNENCECCHQKSNCNNFIEDVKCPSENVATPPLVTSFNGEKDVPDCAK